MSYVFSADVGGTSVKLGFFRDDDTLIKRWEIPTRPENGGCAILPDITAEIDRCIANAGIQKADVLGIGVGVPGPVDDNGNVNCCVNLNWGVFNLHEALGRLTGLRVRAGNDADVAALGEYYDGSGRDCRSMLMVTLGTGIGGGFVWNGHLLHGAHGVAGELGHLIIDRTETERCTCGKYGCAEQYASARGMGLLARRWLAAHDDETPLRALAEVDAKALFAAERAGDAAATAILEQAFEILGETIADACCLVDPELVVLGGGMSKAGQRLLDGIWPYFLKYRFHASEGTRFALASLGNDAGICGCYRLICPK